MKVYLICPVRNASPKLLEQMHNTVKELESSGDEVHFPPRDVNQNDPTGAGICRHHLSAMKLADRVDVFWDNTSNGSYFDLGMAYALGKPINIIKLFPGTDIEDAYVQLLLNMKEPKLFIHSSNGDLARVDQNMVIGVPLDNDELTLNNITDFSTKFHLIESCNSLNVYWNSKSAEDHFHLGMAYALGKCVNILHLYNPDNEGKSYVKVMQQMNGGDYAPNPEKVAFSNCSSELESGISLSA